MKTGKTILMVDDLEINLRLLELFLKGIHGGFNIIKAKNGKEAVEIARDNDLDLILMDIQMPQMNGIEATKNIKEFKPELPIIAISAYLDLDFEPDELECFDQKLTKPINIYDIKKTVLKFIN